VVEEQVPAPPFGRGRRGSHTHVLIGGRRRGAVLATTPTLSLDVATDGGASTGIA